MDDILADVLTSLYAGGLSRFRGETIPELVGFLKVIVRNRAIDFLKERAKRGESPGDESIARVDGGEGLDSQGGVADAECLEFLRQEVEKLKREDRELYLMKARGLKEREIAEQTGRPPGTIASQIARLLDRLRTRLKDRGCV